MGGETAGSETILGAVEDKSRGEPENAEARMPVDNLGVALLGTEADSLRSMLVHAGPCSTGRGEIWTGCRERRGAPLSERSWNQPNTSFLINSAVIQAEIDEGGKKSEQQRVSRSVPVRPMSPIRSRVGLGIVEWGFRRGEASSPRVQGR